MSAILLKLLNMSIAASWVIAVVLLLRLLLRPAPKWTRCLLWLVVAIRLTVPFSFESVISIIPSANTICTEVVLPNVNEETPSTEENKQPTVITPSTPKVEQIVIQSGIPALDNAINPVIKEHLAPTPDESVDPMQIVYAVAGTVWLTGVLALVGYAIFGYWRIRRKVRASIPRSENVWICDDIQSPFLLGVFKPRIYLPSGMDEQTVDHVLAHESSHLARLDHIWKPLGYFILAVHWFNPLVWLSYVLFCKDLELACDEKVIGALDAEKKTAYSQALLNCSTPRRFVAAYPLAFGEVSIKARIKRVLHYKKPAIWVLIVALLATTMSAGCLLTDGEQKEQIPEKDIWLFNEAPETVEFPFSLPDFKTSIYTYPFYTIVQMIDLYNYKEDAEKYLKKLETEEGFTAYYEIYTSLYSGSSVVYAILRDENYTILYDGWQYELYVFEKSKYAPSGITEEQASNLIAQTKEADPEYSAYLTLDITPKYFYDLTGGQIYMQIDSLDSSSCKQNFYLITDNSVVSMYQWDLFDYYGRHDVIRNKPKPNIQIALTDLDQNGIDEVWFINNIDPENIYLMGCENGELKYTQELEPDFYYWYYHKILKYKFIEKDNQLLIFEKEKEPNNPYYDELGDFLHTLSIQNGELVIDRQPIQEEPPQ